MKSVNTLILALSILVGFTLIDILLDIGDDSHWLQTAEELVSVALALAIIYFVYTWGRQQKSALQSKELELASSIKVIQKQSEEMRQARENYSKIIAEQFDAWNLTKAEKETAYCLLKGLSLKEIAYIRDVKEKSVRQQASNIYAKSGVEGRHSLAAWFFEDFI